MGLREWDGSHGETEAKVHHSEETFCIQALLPGHFCQGSEVVVGYMRIIGVSKTTTAMEQCKAKGMKTQ